LTFKTVFGTVQVCRGCNPFGCALEIHTATGSCVGTLLRI
jgi:hypothetical protein